MSSLYDDEASCSDSTDGTEGEEDELNNDDESFIDNTADAGLDNSSEEEDDTEGNIGEVARGYGAQHLEGVISSLEQADSIKFYSPAGLLESKKWPPGSFTSGASYPQPGNKIKGVQWDIRLNALLRQDLQGSLPCAQPKGRVPEGFYWEPSVGGWRRFFERTQQIMPLQSSDQRSVNYGLHLKDETYEGVSITIGLKGAHLPRSHDAMILRYFEEYFNDYHISVEYGGDILKKKNAKEHRHQQCYGKTWLVKDKCTENEIVEDIKKKCGLPKGHQPRSNIVARICENKEDNENMIGYVQKEKLRNTYVEATTFLREKLDEAYELRQHNNNTALLGKKELTKTNLLDECYKFWNVHASPLKINFTEVVTIMLNTNEYQLGKGMVLSKGFDPKAVDAIWALWTSPGNATSSVVENVLFCSQHPIPLLPAVPKLGINSMTQLKRKVRALDDDEDVDSEHDNQRTCMLTSRSTDTTKSTNHRHVGDWQNDAQDENSSDPSDFDGFEADDETEMGFDDTNSKFAPDTLAEKESEYD
mmetsp:Transcript_49983/g.98750  ORF Transcript_49983/g.98750 Transcript_49983/m.98750 type:complete len:532 (+) Transcript_49983:73-1668(+)